MNSHKTSKFANFFSLESFALYDIWRRVKVGHLWSCCEGWGWCSWWRETWWITIVHNWMYTLLSMDGQLHISFLKSCFLISWNVIWNMHRKESSVVCSRQTFLLCNMIVSFTAFKWQVETKTRGQHSPHVQTRSCMTCTILNVYMYVTLSCYMYQLVNIVCVQWKIYNCYESEMRVAQCSCWQVPFHTTTVSGSDTTCLQYRNRWTQFCPTLTHWRTPEVSQTRSNQPRHRSLSVSCMWVVLNTLGLTCKTTLHASRAHIL